MSEYPICSACPDCGSAESHRQKESTAAHRVCRACGAEYLRPTPFWERLIVASVFLIPGLLLFGGLAFVFLGVAVNKARKHEIGDALDWKSCGFFVGLLALTCLAQGIRELVGRKPSAKRRHSDSGQDTLQEDLVKQPPVIPEERAREIVAAIATRHGATRILRLLGALPPRHVANAVAGFARGMKGDEAPLAQVDTSFLQNGKAGLLLTNRAIYSSTRSRPVWLADVYSVDDVAEETNLKEHVWNFRGLKSIAYFLGLHVPLHYLYHLRVNCKLVYRSNKTLRTEFWHDLLLTLGEAAREEAAFTARYDGSETGLKTPVLELTRRRGAGQRDEIKQWRRFSWNEIERCLRTLNGASLPSMRLWTGSPEKSTGLEVLGGVGRYALRELPDGWVYYDPDGSDKKIYVTERQHFPSFCVCKDLDQVLQIVRRFYETRTFE